MTQLWKWKSVRQSPNEKHYLAILPCPYPRSSPRSGRQATLARSEVPNITTPQKCLSFDQGMPECRQNVVTLQDVLHFYEAGNSSSVHSLASETVGILPCAATDSASTIGISVAIMWLCGRRSGIHEIVRPIPPQPPRSVAGDAGVRAMVDVVVEVVVER